MELLVLNRRKKLAARSQRRLGIKDVLDTGLLRIYDMPLCEQKRPVVFEDVWDSHPECGAGVYAAAV